MFLLCTLLTCSVVLKEQLSICMIRYQWPWEAAGFDRPLTSRWNTAIFSVSHQRCNYSDTPNWISNFCLALAFSPSEDLLKCHSEWRYCPFIFPLFLLINIFWCLLFCCGSLKVTLESHKKTRKCCREHLTFCFINGSSNATQIKVITAQVRHTLNGVLTSGLITNMWLFNLW